MKSLLLLVLSIAVFAAPAFAKTDDPSGTESANVCALLVAGQSGVPVAVQRSCDGSQLTALAVQKQAFLEELSYQLSSLYSSGMRLINCQVNNMGVRVEYVCVVAR